MAMCKLKIGSKKYFSLIKMFTSIFWNVVSTDNMILLHFVGASVHVNVYGGICIFCSILVFRIVLIKVR